MSKLKTAGIDFKLVDNGTAVATLTPMDVDGFDTVLPEGTPVPVWVSSDPGVVAVASADGLTASVTPAVPPVLVTGAVLTVTTSLASGTVITGTSDPIDVVAGGPTGFRMSLV